MSFLMIHGDETDLENELPKNCKRINFTDLSIGLDTKHKIIQGEIIKRYQIAEWRKNSHRLKVVLQQTAGSGFKLNVFFLGELAEQADIAQTGDVLCLNNVLVEQCTSGNPDGDLHKCQIIINTENKENSTAPRVWVLHHGPEKASPERNTRSRRSATLADNVEGRNTAANNNTGNNNSPMKRTSPSKRPASSAALSSAAGPSTSTAAVQTPPKKKDREYTYTLLKDVEINTTVYVFGVVKWFREVAKSRGTDYVMPVSIVDPTCCTEEKLKCMLFSKEVDFLPHIKQIGDIVRFHRLKIKEFNGEKQGQAGPGFSCLAFDGEIDAPMEPRSGHTMYTLTEEDKDKVKELREWLSVEGGDTLSQATGPPVLSTLTTFSQLAYRGFGNVVCQVLETCILEDNVCVLLTVWDGTKNQTRSMKEELTQEQLQSLQAMEDPDLVQQDLMVDVKVFDDHFQTAANVKPGDFILLNNLHAAAFKDLNSMTIVDPPCIEYCLHHGHTYNRKLLILDPQIDRDAILLQRKLEAIKVNSGHHDNREEEVMQTTSPVRRISPNKQISPPKRKKSQSPQRNPSRTQTPRNKTPATRKSPRLNKSATAHQSPPRKVSPPKRKSLGKGKTPSKKDKCDDDQPTMSTTAVVGHARIKETTLADVTQASVPNKMKVRCWLTDYQPKKATDLIKVYCKQCHFLKAAPSSSASTTDRWWESLKPCNITGGVKYYNCPQCATKQDKQGGVMLEYTYMIQLTLQDCTGSISAQLWRQHATTFFQDVRPEDALRTTIVLKGVMASLQELVSPVPPDKTQRLPPIQPGSSHHPDMKPFCIMSYHKDNEAAYQIFDTTIGQTEKDGD